MKTRVIILLLFTTIFLMLSADTEEVVKKTKYKLVITDFVENSPLKEAGALPGDMIFKYDGMEVYSLKHLAQLKEVLSSEMAEVALLRNMHHG